MPKIPEFRTGQNADQAHRALKESVAILDRAQHCAVLWFGEIMQRKLYRDLGFSSMRQYAIEALGFSSTRAGVHQGAGDRGGGGCGNGNGVAPCRAGEIAARSGTDGAVGQASGRSKTQS